MGTGVQRETGGCICDVGCDMVRGRVWVMREGMHVALRHSGSHVWAMRGAVHNVDAGVCVEHGMPRDAASQAT